MQSWLRHLSIFALAVIIIGLLTGTMQAQGPLGRSPDGVWEYVPESAIPLSGQRLIQPDRYLTVSLDVERLQTILDRAPWIRTGRDGVMLELPLPDGTFGRFEVFEVAVMAPTLAARYPRIKTYAGQGVDDRTATVRLDTTPQGFHGMILSAHGTAYIDPYSRGDLTHYVVYDRRDYTANRDFEELGPIINDSLPDLPGNHPDSAGATSLTTTNGSQLHTYRAAVAATGEYTQYHGGTVEAGMAAIVTAMNRVNGIYEREVAVNMVLVDNNDQIVYTDGSTDPYSNGNGYAMLYENQNNLDNVIGSANYDIGHVFSTGGGGVASLGSVCVNGSKARGVTGSAAPIGDPFYVDYVAHEMGHQYNANHTFNGNEGSCSGNENDATAYEPGSGSTIMAYAGICGAQDLQNHSDDYFHGASLDEIVAYITSGFGSTCGTVSSTGNTPPTANTGSTGFYLPANTPFRLTGSGSDPDNDDLTYDWEEFDLGANGPPANGQPPFFRSFDPDTSPTRVFPKMSDIVTGVSTIGEQLPTSSRTLHFRLTVRDNRVGGGGIDDDSMSMQIDGGSGPFQVTSPNSTVTWTGDATDTVTWDVAGTNGSPVSCANVDILLSSDGGWTYPTEVLLNTPNDGSESITVPNVSTTQVRIQVQCSDGRFFDISDVDFSIEAVASAPTDLTIAANGTTAELSWTHLGANTDYEVWRDATPYFDVTLGEGTLADTVAATPGLITFPDANRIGDAAANYFWVVRGKVGSSTSDPTKHVGEFDFALIAGTP